MDTLVFSKHDTHTCRGDRTCLHPSVVGRDVKGKPENPKMVIQHVVWPISCDRSVLLTLKLLINQ